MIHLESLKQTRIVEKESFYGDHQISQLSIAFYFGTVRPGRTRVLGIPGSNGFAPENRPGYRRATAGGGGLGRLHCAQGVGAGTDMVMAGLTGNYLWASYRRPGRDRASHYGSGVRAGRNNQRRAAVCLGSVRQIDAVLFPRRGNCGGARDLDRLATAPLELDLIGGQQPLAD